MQGQTSRLLCGDVLDVIKTLPDQSVQCAVTSPPYFGLRDYGVDGQIGLEETPEAYIAKMVEVFAEVKRVLRDDGTLWLNIGDSYAGSGGPGNQYDNKASHGFKGEFQKYDNPNRVVTGLKPKDLIGIPWMLAFALRADGWYLRQDIIWHKPNPMPESVTDRCTKAHEYIFLLSKSARYHIDMDAIAEPAQKWIGAAGEFGRKNEGPLVPGQSAKQHRQRKPAGWDTEKRSHGTVHQDGRAPEVEYSEIDGATRNRRSVWTIATAPYSGAHFATYPPALVEPCIKAGTSERGCCPKCGAPWERVTKPTPEYAEKLRRANDRGDWYARAGTNEKRDDGTKQGKLEGGVHKETVTTGWQPTCKCVAGDPVPCTVLDPFSGSATTGAVALRLGRSYIGIELNPKYIKLSEERLSKVNLPLIVT